MTTRQQIWNKTLFVTGLLCLAMLVATSTGCCASNDHRRPATTDERAAMQTTLQQYVQASRLTGNVQLNPKVNVDDTGQANVGYSLYEPRVQITPLRLHAKMVQTPDGWQVLSNKADPTLHDLSAWPMIPLPQ